MNLRFETTPIAPAPPIAQLLRRREPTRVVGPELGGALLADKPAARANRERLLSGTAWCVTTGQQPGLLTGPLYTIYKALSAVVYAEFLEAQLEQSVVPVFWVAGDDHDFAEANHLFVVDRAHTVRRLALRERPPEAKLLPLYREPVGAEIASVLDALVQETPPSEFRAWVLEWIERHYRPDRDLATAFAGAMADLLGDTGLVVFLPVAAAVKGAMAPVLLRALEAAEGIDGDLARVAQDLQARGQPVPVTVGDGATTVMIEGAMGRDRLILANGRFVARRSGEAWSLDELRQIAQAEPQRLSPNVLLRPVVEAALLPTLGYVAGPGELAYLPQCGPLYRVLNVDTQAPLPRWSARIVESHVAKVLEKYRIPLDVLAGPEGAAEAEAVRDELPAGVTDALTALRAALTDGYARLEQGVEEIDPTLRGAVRSARNAALAGASDLEKRMIAHLKKRDAVATRQIAKARSHLFPLGRPQERVLNVVPFLIRYGRDFLDQAREACTAWLRTELRSSKRT